MGQLKCLTYNLHGFKSGKLLLSEIINGYDVIALQEHWFVQNNLNALVNLNKEYDGIAVSSMNGVDYISGPGRPFGGVGVLWKKTVFKKSKILLKDPDGRYVVVSVQSGNCNFLIINVYLPCVTCNNDYIAKIERIFSEIHAVIDENMSVKQHLLLMGDFNCSYGAMQLKLNLSAIKTFINDWQLNLCNIKSISGYYNTGILLWGNFIKLIICFVLNK